MNYSIVYSSSTGNTALLAETLKQALPAGQCVYFGAPDPEALKADRVYVGFWTDKGSCCEEVKKFLPTLTGQELYLFGTAGFGGEQAYFDRILGTVKALAPDSVRYVGGYMCQGKMPQSVRTRYESMKGKPGLPFNVDDMIANFDRALSHPDQDDLSALAAAVKVSF